MAFEMSPEMLEVQKAFGSSHGYQVNKGLAASDEDYVPLPFPVEFPKFTEKVKFGTEMKEKYFLLEKEWSYLNHGAYGAALKQALDAKLTWLTYCEKQPGRFFEKDFFPHYTHAIRRMAKFIDADRHDVVFVPNATVGNNTVVQSVVDTLKAGDSILMTDLAYGTVQKLLQRVHRETEIRVDVIEVTFPVGSQQSIVKLVEDSIKPDTKFAVFDHVTSVHALVLPIKEMIEVCHKRGIQVLVDGAHCLGSLPISMRDIGADYYVANGHKWCLSPKGCAVLYVDKARQDIVRPLVLSWGNGFGMNSEFGWIVLDFWEFYGPDNIRDHLYKTAKAVGELLVKEWGTELLADTSFFGTMVTVRLPDGLIPEDKAVKVDGKYVYDFSHGSHVGGQLRNDYRVEVPIKAIEGNLYARVSAQIYNEMKDFERLADAVNDIRRKNV